MSWVDGEWYECVVDGFDYIKSPTKGTPAFELTCSHERHGTVIGQWWLTDSVDSKGVPMWRAAKERCKKLGCTEEELNGPGWIEHARENVVGKKVACCIEIEEYEKDGQKRTRAKAKFIGIPTGKGGSGYTKVESAPSFFASKQSGGGDVFSFNGGGVSEDDVPF